MGACHSGSILTLGTLNCDRPPGPPPPPCRAPRPSSAPPAPAAPPGCPRRAARRGPPARAAAARRRARARRRRPAGGPPPRRGPTPPARRRTPAGPARVGCQLVGVSVGRVSWACQLGVPVEPAQAMRLRKSFGWQQCMGALRYEYKFECVLINGRPAAPATVRLELTCRSSARSCTPYWAWRAQRARVCQLGLSVGLVSWACQLGASVGRISWACRLGVSVGRAS